MTWNETMAQLDELVMANGPGALVRVPAELYNAYVAGTRFTDESGRRFVYESVLYPSPNCMCRGRVITPAR